jgi:hypothetical protein
MTLQSLLTMGVFAMAAGCAGQPLYGAIDYQVTGGLGGGGDGTATPHIEPDGTMTRTRPGGATEVRILSAATMRSLRAKIEDANFPALHDSYVECCDRYEHVVSVELAGSVHEVAATEGVAVPRGLQHALDALQALADD